MQETLAIADAVVAALNGSACKGFLADAFDGLGNVPTYTAQRHYVPEFLLKDMGTLKVLVVPKEVEYELEGRSNDRGRHQVYVCVAQRFQQDGTGKTDADKAVLDKLVLLTDRIGRYFRDCVRLPGRESVAYSTREHRPIYDADHLYKNHQLTSLLTLTFREVS